ncbi:MAG: hypothetical protein Q8R91_03975 [Candidatus Omnitrophota bacterium]|nr:hypothetical protein [Candidatus Omnitrophota bacterium]
MVYYLLDASALVLKHRPDPDDSVERAKQVMDAIEAQRKEHEAFLFLPNFCVVEAFNTLAKWFWRERRFRTEEQYQTARKALERDVKRVDGLNDQRRFYAYDLHRYHVLNCNKVFEAEHTTDLEPDPKYPGRFKPPLSSFDILIIAMGVELKKVHAGQSVYIATGDKRLALIAEKLLKKNPDEFARVIDVRKSTASYVRMLAGLPRP